MGDQNWEQLYKLEKDAREKAQKRADEAERRAQNAEQRADLAEKQFASLQVTSRKLLENFDLIVAEIGKVQQAYDKMKAETAALDRSTS